MKGSLCVDSIPGKGSTFWFTVDLSTVGCQEEADPTGLLLSGMRVLVVDDYLPTRAALLKQTEGWGIQSVGASEPGAAIETARAAEREGQPFDVVLWNQQQTPRGVPPADTRFLADPVWNGARRIILASKPLDYGGSQTHDDGRRGVIHLVKPIVPSTLLSALVSCSESAGSEQATWRGMEGPDSNTGSETAQPVQSNRNTSANPGFRAHVLVADDNLINQDLARVLLERLGCKVDVANDGREATELACSVPYDVIFMDCLMPEVDGIEATMEIRRRQSGTRRRPIVALTASAMQGALELCLQAGMDDHISKPVRPQDFSRILNRFLVPPDGSKNADESLSDLHSVLR
jgi:CheY-like chemotaxis protein